MSTSAVCLTFMSSESLHKNLNYFMQIHHHEYLQQGLFRFKYQWLIVTDDNLIGDTEIDVFNIRDIAVLSTKPALVRYSIIYN